MKRPQFTIRSLLVAMLVVAAFFGGMAVQSRLDQPIYIRRVTTAPKPGAVETEIIVLDGVQWIRLVQGTE